MKTGLSRLLPGGRPGRAAAPGADEDQTQAAGQSESDDDEEQQAEDQDEQEEQGQSGSAEDQETQGDEDDDEEEEDEQAQAARGRERTRIAGILRSNEAKGRTATALSLALDTRLSAAEAVKVLGATPKGAAGGLGERMSRVAQPQVGPGGGEGDGDDAQKVAARIRSHRKTRRSRQEG